MKGQGHLYFGVRVRIVRRGRYAAPDSRLREGTGMIVDYLDANVAYSEARIRYYYQPKSEVAERRIPAWLKTKTDRVVVQRDDDGSIQVFPRPSWTVLEII